MRCERSKRIDRCFKFSSTTCFPGNTARSRVQPTYNTLGERGPHQRGQAQVTDLDRACRSCDEDVVTLEVAVHNRRRARVQELQTLQDLPTPAA